MFRSVAGGDSDHNGGLDINHGCTHYHYRSDDDGDSNDDGRADNYYDNLAADDDDNDHGRTHYHYRSDDDGCADNDNEFDFDVNHGRPASADDAAPAGIFP
jgi:predicted lipoprotein with Yx(FWY)xxD motif